MPTAAVGASSSLARIDGLRQLYARLVALCHEREQLLAEATDSSGPLQPAAPSIQGKTGQALLRDKLRQDPCFHAAGSSLLLPPPGMRDASGLHAGKEELFAKLAELDAAIGALTVIADAGASDEGSAGSSRASADGESTQLPLCTSIFIEQFAGVDGELQHYVDAATANVRQCASYSADAWGRRASGMPGEKTAGDVFLPMGASYMRPYLSIETRKRMRQQHNELIDPDGDSHASSGPTPAPKSGPAHTPGQGGAMPPPLPSGVAPNSSLRFTLPLGGQGASTALRLVEGDVLHVPFTAAEAIVLRRRVSARSPRHSSSDVLAHGPLIAPCPLPIVSALGVDARAVPCVHADDCWRFWISPENADFLGTRAVAPGRLAVAPGGAMLSASAAAPHAPAGIAEGSAGDARVQWVLHARGSGSTNDRSVAKGVSQEGGAGQVRKRSRGGEAPLMRSLYARASGFNSIGRDTASYRAQVWRSLHCGFRAGSVSHKPTGHVADVAFAPFSHPPMLAVGSTNTPHEALLYDLRKATNTVLGSVDARANVLPLAAHRATVCSVRFNASGGRLLTASYDRTVRVWRPADGSLEWVLGEPVVPPPPPDETMGEHPEEEANDDGSSHGGNGAADAGEGEEDGNEEESPAGATEPGDEPGSHNGDDDVGTAGFPEGVADAHAAEPPVAAPWAYAGSIPGHTDHVICVASHPTQDSLAASGGKDSAIILWDITHGRATRTLHTPHDPLDLAFGHDASAGTLFAAIDAKTYANGGHGNGQLSMWDIEAGKCFYALPQPRGHVSCLHCSADGLSVLAGSADGTVRQLSSVDGSEMFALKTGMSDVNLVSLSCGQTYVQASGDKNLTFIIDVRRPNVPVHVLRHDAPVSGFVNGVSAAWCHHSHATLVTGSDDATVRIWDVSRATPEVARLTGHTSPVSCVAISPDDDLIASGGDEGKVVLYGRRTTACHAPFRVGRENDIVLIRHQRRDEDAWRSHLPDTRSGM